MSVFPDRWNWLIAQLTNMMPQATSREVCLPFKEVNDCNWVFELETFLAIFKIHIGTVVSHFLSNGISEYSIKPELWSIRNILTICLQMSIDSYFQSSSNLSTNHQLVISKMEKSMLFKITANFRAGSCAIDITQLGYWKCFWH